MMVRPLCTTLLLLPFLAATASAQVTDCNGNGTEDAADLAVTDLSFGQMSGVSLPNATITAENFIDIDLDGRLDLAIAGEAGFLEGSSIVPKLFGAYALQNNRLYGESQRVEVGIPVQGIGPDDVDNNSFLDLVFAGTNVQTTLFNQGNATFVPVVNQPSTSVASTRIAPAVGVRELTVDLNGDGRDDQLTLSDTDKLEVSLQEEGGSFTIVHEYQFPASTCLTEGREALIMPAEDVDGDGDVDLLITDGADCPGAVSGTFRTSTVLLLQNEGDAFVETEAAVNFDLTFAQYRDVNLDGVDDLVFLSVGSDGCNGPVSFCGFVPREHGVQVLPVFGTRISRDQNGNTVPDECERAVPGDFDGDRRADITAVRALNGLLQWYSLTDSRFVPLESTFGLAQFDLPYAGDFDGDGKVEPAVVRDAGDVIPGLFGLWWYSKKPDGSAETVQWGLKGDQPIVGYFDNDNRADHAVVRTELGQRIWYIRPSGGGDPLVIPWGLASDAIFAADLTGDRIDDLIVAREFLGGVSWFVRTLDNSFSVVVQWGLAGDIPLPPADLDGDGRGDLVVVRRSGSLFHHFIRRADGTITTAAFGLVTDIPSLSYTGGENSAELSVLRPAPTNVPFAEAFHYQRTQDGFIRTTPWGLAGDWFIRNDGLGIRP